MCLSLKLLSLDAIELWFGVNAMFRGISTNVSLHLISSKATMPYLWLVSTFVT